MAETVLRAALASAGLAGQVIVDSAGTGDWHIGHQMNSGARAALARRGYDGSAHRARQFDSSWLRRRDLILALDSRNLADLRRMAGPAERDRIRLFGEVGNVGDVAGLGGAADRDIPDPYGGDAAEFGYVLDLLTGAAPVIAARLAQLLEPSASQPASLEPPASQPSSLEPPASQPSSLEPPATQPSSLEPPATQPSSLERSASQPSSLESSVPEPSASEPPA
jgi:protein-tyrosine phosphatase